MSSRQQACARRCAQIPLTRGENAGWGLVIMSQKRNSASYVLQTLPIKTSKFLKANDFLNPFKHIQHPLGSSVSEEPKACLFKESPEWPSLISTHNLWSSWNLKIFEIDICVQECSGRAVSKNQGSERYVAE